ncbi:tetratricopeptide repeat protein, partial [Alishewanella tabrizica]|uniref:tetratricopeptide repeat protein n=1 Tax=Alishewanella tabrizica TaxID=671278 RepID=UPI0016739317
LTTIDQCLAFKVSERPQTMQQVALQLSPYSEAKHTEAPLQSGTISKKTEPVSTVVKKNYSGWAMVTLTTLMVLAAVSYQYYLGNQNYSEPIAELVNLPEDITVVPLEIPEAKALRLAAEEAYYSSLVMDPYGVAFGLYQQAAALGSAYADSQLAMMYLRGQGVTKNAQLARQYRDTAVQKFSQHPIGGHENAELYKLAALVELDTEAELSQYRIRAEQGDANAQYKIGMLYDQGEGYRAQQDAVIWFYKAAEQGHPGAQQAVATRYIIGRGVYLSDADAHKWYLKAAEQDDPWAQYVLGSNYLNGKGVTRSTSEAIKWLYKAAQNGHPTAAKWVTELEKNDTR